MKKAFCSVIFSMTRLYETVLTSDLNFPSYLSRQKGTSGNISQPQPVHFSASASKNFPSVPFFLPWLQKTFTCCPFFNLGNFGQTSNQTWTNLSSDVVSTKIETKYYLFTLHLQEVVEREILSII